MLIVLLGEGELDNVLLRSPLLGPAGLAGSHCRAGGTSSAPRLRRGGGFNLSSPHCPSWQEFPSPRTRAPGDLLACPAEPLNMVRLYGRVLFFFFRLSGTFLNKLNVSHSDISKFEVLRVLLCTL